MKLPRISISKMLYSALDFAAGRIYSYSRKFLGQWYMSIYSRLYNYRDTPSLSPLENFLTEALADLFNRLPLQTRIEFLVGMLPPSCSGRLQSKCRGAKQIKAETQVSIPVSGTVKRPDIIVYLDHKPLVLFELKVDAAFQERQLETYTKWIGSQCSGEWPGAVVFLTHRTRAPSGFESDGRNGNSVIGVTQKWKYLGDWLANNFDLNQSEATHCALAADLNRFLERQGLMTEFMTSRDLAATELFMPAFRALEHTFRTVILEVVAKYPKSKGGRIRLDFWPNANAYCGWYALNRQLNPESSKFSISIGICFPGCEKGELTSEIPVRAPMHEPFFFVVIADDLGNKKASELFSAIPKGWVEVNEGYYAIVTRAVSQFEADPDARASSLTAWAQEEVGKAMSSITNFEAVSAENIPEEVED
jgi:hypothetical protein